MLFIILMGFITFMIAASAAFFSVFGMMQIYSAVMIPILIMGTSLEAGKLAAASYLYRHWTDTGFVLKTGLFAGIIVLMLITSIGIFGYLTAAYQKDSQPIKQIEQTLVDNKLKLQKLEDRKGEIDKQISQLPNNFINGRKALIATFKPELDTINPKIAELQTIISDTKIEQLDTETHMGPIVFVAKVLGRNPDDSVFYFTLIIMSVFDPMAVGLTIATNTAIRARKRERVVNIPQTKALVIDRMPTDPTPVEPEITVPAIVEPVIVEPAIVEPAITEPEITEQPTPVEPEITEKSNRNKTHDLLAITRR